MSQVGGYYPPGEPYQQNGWILIRFLFFLVIFINPLFREVALYRPPMFMHLKDTQGKGISVEEIMFLFLLPSPAPSARLFVVS